MRRILNDLFFSLPVQLLFLHIKKNLSILSVWVFFIVFVFGVLGRVYGIHYLFLDPEYLDKVGFLSFFVVGAAFGLLTMSFHMTCYILDGYKFSFIGALDSPFTKFSVNNSLIPLVAFVIYLSAVIQFQLDNEFISYVNLLFKILGLISGVVTMCVLIFGYLQLFNNKVVVSLTVKVDGVLRKSGLSRERMMARLKETRLKKHQITFYLGTNLNKIPADNFTEKNNKKTVLKAFDQNQFNTVVLELSIVLFLVFLGTFMDYSIVQIPAAASVLLMLSIVVMLVGAISYWFRGWGVPFALSLVIAVNIMIGRDWLKGTYQAKGLDYTSKPVEYSLDQLKRISSASQYEQDKQLMLKNLENWKAKQSSDKPKIIFNCISGGGQRSALWALLSLQKSDSVLGGKLMDQSILITGASGGLIGGAYFRELKWRESLGQSMVVNNQEQLKNIAKDNLNPIIFSLLVNDLFLIARNQEYEGKPFTKDRGHVFEENLNSNLGNVLSKKLIDYSEPEKLAEMPMVIMSPVIANDGRKLYVSSQPVSFMNVSGEFGVEEFEYKMRGVEFNGLFSAHGNRNLSFMSALRMSASFPYVTPTISLPSEPVIEIMDAGISDNYGVSDALTFIGVFKEWIEQNTSGIVLLVIRDSKKNSPIEPHESPSLISNLTFPISSVYNNLGNIRDIENDRMIEAMRSWYDTPIDLVELEYDTYTSQDSKVDSPKTNNKPIKRASLSWHLTTREKRSIIRNMELESNQKSLRRLRQLMGNE